MKEKKFREKLVEGLELPAATLKSCPRIELSSNRMAVVEGCMGIIEYSDEKIALSLGTSCLKINGSSLEIITFDCETVTISGNFTALLFC